MMNSRVTKTNHFMSLLAMSFLSCMCNWGNVNKVSQHHKNKCINNEQSDLLAQKQNNLKFTSSSSISIFFISQFNILITFHMFPTTINIVMFLDT